MTASGGPLDTPSAIAGLIFIAYMILWIGGAF
jgi:hypothetical protein